MPLSIWMKVRGMETMDIVAGTSHAAYEYMHRNIRQTSVLFSRVEYWHAVITLLKLFRLPIKVTP
jgi:hypothetical protein